MAVGGKVNLPSHGKEFSLSGRKKAERLLTWIERVDALIEIMEDAVC